MYKVLFTTFCKFETRSKGWTCAGKEPIQRTAYIDCEFAQILPILTAEFSESTPIQIIDAAHCIGMLIHSPIEEKPGVVS